jgi:hypothetical protein
MLKSKAAKEAGLHFLQRRHQRPVHHISGGDRRNAAQGGQRQALRHELSNDSLPSSAQRHTNRYFGLTRRASGRHEIRQVCTGDQQQHTGGREEHRQRRRHLITGC